MDEISAPKPHRKNDYPTSVTASKRHRDGYDVGLGLMGQPRSFYAGLATGIVFLVAMLSLLQIFLSRI